MSKKPEIEIGKDDQDDPENKHSAGARVNQFCALRMDTCTCEAKNKYKDVVKGKNAKESAKFKRPEVVTKKGIPTLQLSSENAHHLVCVASVTKLFAKNIALREVVSQTIYCINKISNMIALPLFAHTIHWYITSKNRGLYKFIDGLFSLTEAPPFENIPNHNYDHKHYIEELEIDLQMLAGFIEMAKHGYDPSDLVKELDDVSDCYRKKLVDRGIRRGGTHQCWLAAMYGEDDLWFHPFSMASDADVTRLEWPGRGFGEERTKPLEKLRKALLNLVE